MQPTIGRIVHYKLSADDAKKINRRRTTGAVIAERIPRGEWPLGAQAHIGNEAREGKVFPMLVVAVFATTDLDGPVNGQVFLNGDDTLWVCSVKVGTEPGSWAWPPRG